MGTMLRSSPSPAAPAARSRKGLAALINPLSFRMSLGDRARLSAARVKAHGGHVFEVRSLEQIEQALERALARSIDRLVIAGGDGTLQASVSFLARHLPPERLPELIALGAGRTNYVAEDIGTGDRFIATLEHILSVDSDRLHPVQRRSLEVQHEPAGSRYGFFLAGASVDQAIRYVHDWQNAHPGWRRRHHLATTFGLVSLAVRCMTRRFRFESPPLCLGTDTLGALEGRCRFLVATTLALNTHRIDPYARRGHGPLRLTAIARGARGLPWRLPRLLRGRFTSGMNIENGYLSGHCNDVVINGLKSMVLDGQEFDLDPACPLRLRPGPVFRFLRP